MKKIKKEENKFSFNKSEPANSLSQKSKEINKKAKEESQQLRILRVDYRWLVYLTLFAIFLIGLATLASYLVFYKSTKYQIFSSENINYLKNINVSQEEKELTPRRIDGIVVEKGKENLYPVAAVIDNHEDSRPQTGLSKALIVYETLVEGDATRFLAFYAGEQVEKIGPIRSVRPVFLEWVKEFEALFAHSGGSKEALEKIIKWQIKDLEEISSLGPEYFWRDKEKKRPHNLFTSSKNLSQAIKDFGLDERLPDFEPWTFKAPIKINFLYFNFFSFLTPQVKAALQAPEEIPDTRETLSESLEKKLYIDFSPGIKFDVEYKYQTSTQSYLRFENGKPHIDALTLEPISVKNVIIQFIPQEIVKDKMGHLNLQVQGQGKVLVFREGEVFQGTWQKLYLESRTKFYDSSGREIELTPGNIWIEVVPGNRKVDY